MIRSAPVPRRSLALLVPLVVLAAVVGVPASGRVPAVSADADHPLARDLDAILADPSLAGADVGLVVRRADGGEVLYQSQSNRRGQPASTNKLITSAAVLEILGPAYRFTTSVHATGKIAHGVLAGDLYLRGTGDPTMLAGDYDALAAQVAASGARAVGGKLVADDTWFDDVRLGDGWASDDEPYYYNAQISALTVSPDTDYDAGSIIVRVSPSAPGAPATVRTDPPTSYVKLVNNTVTGPAGSASTVTVDRAHGTNTITISGSVPANSAESAQWVTVWEPTGLVASLFRDALARHGVRVFGDSGRGTTPTGARVLAEHRSMPLSELQVPFLKLSNNMHAEILLKSAGRAVSGAGSWAAGRRALAGKLPGLGIDPAKLFLVDGSGLSRMDHVAPDQIAALLVAARTKPWFPAWYEALPIAGAADRMVGGTLRSRMRGTPAEGNVHAKTGSLTGVSALAGYVTAANGEQLVFSMMSNNVLGASPKALEDAVAVRLAKYAGDADVRTPAPVTRPLTQPVSGDDADGRRAWLECSWLKAC